MMRARKQYKIARYLLKMNGKFLHFSLCYSGQPTSISEPLVRFSGKSCMKKLACGVVDWLFKTESSGWAAFNRWAGRSAFYR